MREREGLRDLPPDTSVNGLGDLDSYRGIISDGANTLTVYHGLRYRYEAHTVADALDSFATTTEGES